MKNLLTICILMFGMNVNAQEPVAAIELPESNVLYRGYANKIIPAVSNNNGGTLFLAGQGVSISKAEEDDYFIAKPMGSNREVSILVNLIHGTDTTLLRKVDYRVMNLPDPSIYWGSAEGGYKGRSKANIREKNLSVNYFHGFPLKSEFTVVSWELTVDSNLVVMGNGSSLHEAEETLKKITETTIVTIRARVIGQDRITRVREASWEVDPWEETEER